MSRPAREQLAVFARSPRLGRVKTRLCPPLNADQALVFHRALVEDTLERLSGPESGRERVLYLSDPLPAPDALDFPDGWDVDLQRGGGLGERLGDCFGRVFGSGVERLVVVGSDSPTLPVEYVEEAFAALDKVNVVLGPTRDGGYYLVGACGPAPELFQNIAWGTEKVLEQSREGLARAGRSVQILAPWYDVDRPQDITRLREEVEYLGRHATGLVPRRVAATLSLWGASSPSPVAGSVARLESAGGWPGSFAGLDRRADPG